MSRANAITAGGLVVLLGLIVLTAPRWTRLLTRDVPGEDLAGEDGPREAAGEGGAGAVERQINVKLLFPAGDRPGLVMEERTVAFSDDLSHQLRKVVEEIVRGPSSAPPEGGAPPPDALQRALPPETRVLNVFVSPAGVAYVDLSREVVRTGRGSFEELLAVYSIVNSLTVNFPAVRRVQILVEDRPAQTLWGHVDLTHALRPDMTLLAATTLTPASPDPDPNPAAGAPATPPS